MNCEAGKFLGTVIYLAGDSYAVGDGMEKNVAKYLADRLKFHFVPQSELLTFDSKSRVELGKLFHERVEGLNKLIESLQAPLILIGRSSGARIASLCAESRKVAAVICLAYPFKHPSKIEEKVRYQHLEFISKPTLIIQGVRDEYGGLASIQKYKFSEYLNFYYLNAHHNMNISEPILKVIRMRIERFLYESKIFFDLIGLTTAKDSFA
jgi:predicted alpha/beta-hydrolase family hydrolase